MEVGLVDLAVQAVGGSKIQGNASRNCTFDAAGLQKLLDWTEVAVAELEAQNEGGDDPPPPRQPEKLGFFHYYGFPSHSDQLSQLRFSLSSHVSKRIHSGSGLTSIRWTFGRCLCG